MVTHLVVTESLHGSVPCVGINVRQPGHGISKGKVNKYNVIVVCGVQLHDTFF